MAGQVYFIIALGREKSLVKIGFTNGNPVSRLKALQTGSPSELMLIATITGGVDLERALHATFAVVHERGEWFHFTGRLFSLVAALHVASDRGTRPLNTASFFAVCKEYLFDPVPVILAEGDNDETWHETADLGPLVRWFQGHTR